MIGFLSFFRNRDRVRYHPFILRIEAAPFSFSWPHQFLYSGKTRNTSAKTPPSGSFPSCGTAHGSPRCPGHLGGQHQETVEIQISLGTAAARLDSLFFVGNAHQWGIVFHSLRVHLQLTVWHRSDLIQGEPFSTGWVHSCSSILARCLAIHASLLLTNRSIFSTVMA